RRRVAQVAPALVPPADIVYPLRTVLRRARNVAFHQARITGVDFERRVVVTARGLELPYDHLVLATGSVSDFFGNPALAESTLGMKTIEQAQRLRNHVLACLERAAQEPDADARPPSLTFVVAGGGPAGREWSARGRSGSAVGSREGSTASSPSRRCGS